MALATTEFNLSMLPANVEAERSILGAILLDNFTYTQASSENLQADDFSLDSHRRIYGRITELADSATPADRDRIGLLMAGGGYVVWDLANAVSRTASLVATANPGGDVDRCVQREGLELVDLEAVFAQVTALVLVGERVGDERVGGRLVVLAGLGLLVVLSSAFRACRAWT